MGSPARRYEGGREEELRVRQSCAARGCEDTGSELAHLFCGVQTSLRSGDRDEENRAEG